MKQNYRSWLSTFVWDIAFTMNFRPNINREQAERAARHFWNRMDVSVFGSNSVKRHRTRVNRVCFWEGADGVKNWHCHAAIALPVEYEREAFKSQLLLKWAETKEAGKFSVCDDIHDSDGWIDYITKDASFTEDAFDAVTSHI